MVVGEGPQRREIQLRLSRVALGYKVQLLGYLPLAKLCEVQVRTEAVVVPSTWE